MMIARDNHVMRYESRGSRSNAGHQASCHCGFEGCSVRYDPTDGYYMLIGMPNHANPVDEPGVNALRCPRHAHWLCAARISMPDRLLVGAPVSEVVPLLTVRPPRTSR